MKLLVIGFHLLTRIMNYPRRFSLFSPSLLTTSKYTGMSCDHITATPMSYNPGGAAKSDTLFIYLFIYLLTYLFVFKPEKKLVCFAALYIERNRV